LVATPAGGVGAAATTIVESAIVREMGRLPVKAGVDASVTMTVKL